jgi:hypothetical protein
LTEAIVEFDDAATNFGPVVSKEIEQVLSEASTATGLHDFGDNWFHSGLEAWITDLDRPNLTDFGQSFLRRLAVRDVARRLRVLATFAAHPEIADVKIPPILYVTGLERSGTTLLHNLLSQHSRARPLLRWELMEPVPPPESATFADDPRIEKSQRSVDALRGSLIERMHWVNATDPEECPWAFIDAVGMLGGAAAMCMPAWAAHSAESQRRAYENYRRVVQLLLWKHPLPDDGFLVLKAPQIAKHVAEFQAVFPEAQFIIPDRDPFRCIVSLAAMIESIVEPFCVENPVTNDGQRDRVIQNRAEPALTALAAFTETSPQPTIHVPYPSLVSDPLRTVSGIFDSVGIPFESTDSIAATGFLDAQRGGTRVRPPNVLPLMGYDHEETLATPSIRQYCERFGIARETERITGA